MPLERQAQDVGHACRKVLKRLTVREADQMRRTEPARMQVRPPNAHLIVGEPLPVSVVHIVEVLERHDRYAARQGDRAGGLRASLKWTAVRDAWLSLTRHALRRAACLARAQLGQVDVASAAEALRGYSFDVSVADEDDPCHVGLLARIDDLCALAYFNRT